MTTQPDPEPHGLIGATHSIGSRVVGSLPAQFLALCIVNLVFIAGVLWFLERTTSLQATVAEHVFDRCISGALAIPAPTPAGK